MIRVALVGDHDPAVTAHRAIPEALRLAADALSPCGPVAVSPEWIHTTRLGPDPAATLAEYDAVWLVPASPYADTAAALAAVRVARETDTPFLGTCGGFQHALLEYAAAVWKLGVAATHAELDPGAPDPVIAPLSCSLVEETDTVRFAAGSRLAVMYEADMAREGYHCRYGLNPSHAGRLAAGPLRAVAWDAAGEVRAVELTTHPFFVATLFQPERAALEGRVPPVVRGLLEAARTAAAHRSRA